MRLNPLSLFNNTKKPGQGTALATEEKTSPADSRKKAEELAVANVSEAVPKFQTIKTLDDLATMLVSTNKEEDSKLRSSAQKVLKAIRFGAAVPKEQFIEGHIANSGSDPKTGAAKLVVDMSGKEAIKRYFKTGFIHTLFGWVPRLFGRANQSYGIKWLKQNSGIQFFDPSGGHSKMDDPKRVKELLSSGRYAVSVVYKTDKDGNFTKEPESIVLLDLLHKVMEDMEQKIDSIHKDLQNDMREKIKRFKKEQLNSYCMVNTALINPKSKSLYDKNDDESLAQRETLLSSVFESLDEHTSFIVPNEVFGSRDAKTNKYQYDQLPDMAFIYTNKDQSQVGTFGKTATLVTNRTIHKEKIPEKDLSELMAIAMASEHISTGSTMIEPLNKAMSEIESKNTKAFEVLNAKLAS